MNPEALVQQCLGRVLPPAVARAGISTSARLVEDLGMDSLMLLSFVTALEDVLARRISESDLRAASIKTVEDAIRFVEVLGGAAAGSSA